jgi:hypothetical protein
LLGCLAAFQRFCFCFCLGEIGMTTRILRSALLPYPAQTLYDLVNDVARYPEFLPWCSATEVLEVSEVQMLARLVIALLPVINCLPGSALK